MKRKNQKVSAWYILLLLSVIVYACVDDSTNTPEPAISEVKFSVSLPADEGGRADNNVADVRYVVFSVTSDNGDTPYEFEQLELLSFDGDYISEPFSLEVGDYELTDFLLLDDNGDVLFATPKTGSAYAKLVNSPLSIDFEVTKDAVTKLTPEVVSAAESTAADFGYAAFGFEVAEFFSLPITVMVYDPDVENYVLVTADLTIEADSTIILEEELDAATNEVRVKDESHDSYTLTVAKDGYDDFNYTYSADSLRGYEGNDPLLVLLSSINIPDGLLYGIGTKPDGTIVFGSMTYSGEETIIAELDLNGDIIHGTALGSHDYAGGIYSFEYISNNDKKWVAFDTEGNILLQLHLDDYSLGLGRLTYSETDSLFYGIGQQDDGTLFFGSLDFLGNETIIQLVDSDYVYYGRGVNYDDKNDSFLFSLGNSSLEYSCILFETNGNQSYLFQMPNEGVRISLSYSQNDQVLYGFSYENQQNTFGYLDLNGVSTQLEDYPGGYNWNINGHRDFDQINNLYFFAAGSSNNTYSIKVLDNLGMVIGSIDKGELAIWTFRVAD